MSEIVKLGTAFINGVKNVREVAFPYAVYSSGLEESSTTLVWRGYPLTLFTDGNGRFSLAVVPSAHTQDSTVVYRSQKLALATGLESKILGFILRNESSEMVDTVCFRGISLGVNINKTLVLTSVSLVPDETHSMYLKGTPINIIRKGLKWYLPIAEM
jgi:hypothetical protein